MSTVPGVPVGARYVLVTPGDTLWGLAQTHLGSGMAYSQIWDLNANKTMTTGESFHSRDLIRPGWTPRGAAADVAIGVPAAVAGMLPLRLPRRSRLRHRPPRTGTRYGTGRPGAAPAPAPAAPAIPVSHSRSPNPSTTTAPTPKNTPGSATRSDLGPQHHSPSSGPVTPLPVELPVLVCSVPVLSPC